MDAAETFECNGHTVEIHYDECEAAIGPRGDDPLVKIILFGKAKPYGDEHDYRMQDYAGWAELRAAVAKDHPGGVVKPVFIFDHSGIALSTTDAWFRAVDSAGWDWCQVGVAVVSGDRIREVFGKQRISKKLREAVEGYVDDEVTTQGRYVNGEWFYWLVKDAEGEIVDSVGGYVGIEHAIEAAREYAETL